MMESMRRRVSHAGEDGAALMFAVILVGVVSLVVGVLLTRGDGSLRAAVQLRDVAGRSYAADAAADVAINNLRTGAGFTGTDKFNNTSPDEGGAGCFGGSITSLDAVDELPMAGFYPMSTEAGVVSSAYVECEGEAGTGAQGSPVQISVANRPGQAILALGARSSNGLKFGRATSETDAIHGSITSNTFLDSKGTLNVTGNGVRVNARNGCTGRVLINGVASPCGTTTLPDPNYAAPGGTPTLAAAPQCPSSDGGPKVFRPGLYTMTPDKAGVIAEVQQIAISSGTSSGTFTPALTGYPTVPAQAWNVPLANLQSALRSAWSIDVVVTGTPGANYVITFPTILGDVPSIAISAATLGPGAAKKATPSTATAGSATCPKTVGWFYFAPSSSSSTGIYWFNWSGKWVQTGTVVGGTLSLAKDGTTSGGSTITPSGSMAAPTNPGACVNPILSADAVGVELVFGGASQLEMQNTALKEFCATYSDTSIPTVVYGLKQAVGSVPAQSGCVASGTCEMILAANGKQAVFYFQGFVYAPWAWIYLDANNVSQPFFNFGIISDTLFVGANPSNKCEEDGELTCAFINLPDDSPGYGTKSTIVVLKVRVCLNSATVTADCKTKDPDLVVRAQLWDPDGDPANRQIKVLSWSHNR